MKAKSKNWGRWEKGKEIKTSIVELKFTLGQHSRARGNVNQMHSTLPE